MPESNIATVEAPVGTEVANVQSDRRRPYKLYATIVSAMIVSLLAQEVVNGKPWVVAILTTVGAGIAVYTVRNPQVVK